MMLWHPFSAYYMFVLVFDGSFIVMVNILKHNEKVNGVQSPDIYMM